MRGMDRNTGKYLEGWDYAKQCFLDAVLTLVGTRVLRRGYGASLPGMIDAPINSATFLDFAVACTSAAEQLRHLRTGERLISFERLEVREASQEGRATFIAHVLWHEDNSIRTVEL